VGSTRKTTAVRWFALISLFLIGGCALWDGEVADEPEFTVSSEYVEVSDGTHLAVDVWRPDMPAVGLPAIVQFTRYWRAFAPTKDGPMQPKPETDFFLSMGYAVVIVDVRGTGASFGHRTTEFSNEELQDAGEILQWVSEQSWSNGRVATVGASYLGNMAEMAAMQQTDALVASIPRFTDFSEYRHAIRPGGIRNAVISDAWADLTKALDANDPCQAFSPNTPCTDQAPWRAGVKPVDSDKEGALLAAAVAEHAQNISVSEMLIGLRFTDDTFGRSNDVDVTLDDVSPAGRWRAIDAAGVPALHFASWFDGGTAEGALTRYENYETPLRVVIGPWSHGGGPMAMTIFGTEGDEPDTNISSQYQEIAQFLEPMMFSDKEGPDLPSVIRYFMLGANEWRETEAWPPKGVNAAQYFLSPQGHMRTESPLEPGDSKLDVDFSATTGRSNRWHTQLGVAVSYPAGGADASSGTLQFESAAVEQPLEIVGTPTAALWVESSQPDASIFVYLKAISPTGQATYLADGQIRLSDRKRQADAEPGRGSSFNSFLKKDSEPMPLNQPEAVEISLSPIAVEVPAGYRLRFEIAGADADTFERVPQRGPVTLTFLQTRDNHSTLSLPVQH
jgi:putative CocE/NonD family hydrolase